MSGCEVFNNLANNWLFQTGQCYTVFILSLAIIALSFIHRKIIHSTFHGNLKVLYIGYFSSLLFNSIYHQILTIYILIHINLAKIPCDVLLNNTLFRYGHQLVILSHTLPMLFPLIISFERILCICYAHKYENFKSIIGQFLTVSTVLLATLPVYFLFHNEKFEESTISFNTVPQTSTSLVYPFFWALLALNVANIFFNFFLLKYSKNLRKIETTSLSFRYQLDQVIFSSKFLTVVLLLNIVYFCSILAATKSRQIFQIIFHNSPMQALLYQGTIFTITSTMIFLIGLISTLYYNKLKNDRKKELRRHLLNGSSVFKEYRENHQRY